VVGGSVGMVAISEVREREFEIDVYQVRLDIASPRDAEAMPETDPRLLGSPCSRGSPRPRKCEEFFARPCRDGNRERATRIRTPSIPLFGASKIHDSVLFHRELFLQR